MIRAKNYETVSKFVKVMTKILWPLFFPDTVYIVCSSLQSFCRLDCDLCGGKQLNSLLNGQ